MITDPADAGCQSPERAIPLIYRAGLGRRLPLGYIRIGSTVKMPEVLRRLGADPEGIMRSVGVPMSLFADPDNALPFSDFCRLISTCAKASGRDDFGLVVCEETTASDLGLVGFLLQQAPDVRTALDDLVRYLHHSDRGAVPFMTIQAGMVEIGYTIHEPYAPATEQIYDGALAVGRNVLRGLLGPQWTPTEVTLARRHPPVPARYERFFGAPVRFDAERTAFLFAEHWLDTPIPRADPALRRMLQEQVDLLEAEEADSFPEQVRRLLRTCLLTKAGSVEDVARLLKTSKRTLARRLEAEGTSFRALSDEIQYEIARQLLANTAMTITQIAFSLKYSEGSAFSRAFRQWAGISPREWRVRQHEAQAPAPLERGPIKLNQFDR